ncbi:LPS translocon maturation chaperone LptM [Massilia sp. S19_KUP03_FR1]|uniref:LPS translocon maturation chaperone LptM n=1 Tax=Massilia sp. S19_KUP03_FR1 TaxID=3025503 RepID=UPI002FCDB690
MKSTFAFLCAAFVLSGCGQTGPLYMPKAPPGPRPVATGPVTVLPPAATPGTPASQQPSPPDASPVPAQQ